MNRTSCIVLLSGILAISSIGTAAIRGVVFDDANNNNLRDPGEKGIANVSVSDQEAVVRTDSQGRYELPGGDHATVFVCTPAAYEAPPAPETGVPRFFRNLHASDRGLFKATGPIPESVDFALRRRGGDADRFRMIVFADPQVSSQAMISYFRSDAVDELMAQKADLVATLGDITGDSPALLDDMATATAAIGVPVYGVIGNHDRNFEAENLEESPATFKEVYGPDWYSFDRGKVHFIALNTVYFTNNGSRYESGLNGKQLKWLKADLANVPADRMICLLMHIPLIKETTDEKQHGFDRLLELLKGREAPILALAGHWHTNNAFAFGEKDGWTGKAPFHHYVVPTQCGGWWGGPDDYRGIPSADQSDGTPNGYTIWDFDGTSYKARYKASNFSDSFQARVYTPDMRDSAIPAKTVLANIFFAPAAAKVEMSLDAGEWQPMERVVMKDPWAESVYDTPYAKRASWMDVTLSEHIWRAPAGSLDPGLHKVQIRASMLDGTTLEQGKTFYIR
jgi:3',5'-cyclic AMP phosphodiesterase CpdA